MANNQLGIFWTALPNTAVFVPARSAAEEVDSYRLGFSATVAFRLLMGNGSTANTTLNSFPDLLDWPRLVKQAETTWELHLEFAVGAAPFRRVAQLVSAPVTSAWAHLFPSTTVVTPQPPSNYDARDNKKIRSYPRREVGDFVRGLHSGVQTSIANPASQVVTAPIPNTVLYTAFDKVRPFRDAGFATQVNEFINPRAGNPATWVISRDDRASLASNLQIASDFVQLNSYYRRLADMDNPNGTRAVRKGPEFKEQDFHQLSAMALLQPRVARELGLILDFEVEVPATLVGEGVMSIQPTYALNGLDRADVYYRTAYVLADDETFEIPAGDPNFDGKGRFLQLGNTRLFSFEDGLDVDSAALKATDFEGGLTNDELKASDLPSLRTTGISINRTDNSLRLAEQRQRDRQRFNSAFGSTKNSSDPSLSAANRVQTPDFVNYAEDLVRGYRFDVWDESQGRWRSLHQREGDYRIGSPGDEYVVASAVGDEAPPDEGFVSMVPTRPAAVFEGQSVPDEYYLSESLMRWSGWSLSVPRVGAPITNEDRTLARGADNLPAFPRLDSSAGRVVANLRTALNLPRLRFGRQYRFRARVVDTAGNSVPFNQHDRPDEMGQAASEVVTFRRYDPVESPTLVYREAPTVGEGVHELVVRSEDRDEISDGVSRRLVPPPATGQWLAESHGLFDRSIGRSHTDATDQYNDLLVNLEGRSWANSPLYAALPDADGAFRIPTSPDDPPIEPPAPGTTAPPSAAFMIPMQPDDDLVDLPYMADPAAYQLQVRRLPGNRNALVQYGPNYWPYQTPAKLELVKTRDLVGAGDYSVGGTWDDTVTVALTKGDVVTLLMSNALEDETDNDPPDPNFITADKFGLYTWTVDRLIELFPNANPDDIRRGVAALVQAGYHRAITPPQEVRLVHAVRKPLAAPNFELFGDPNAIQRWQIERREGETVGRANGQIGYSPKSTGRLDVRATWINTVDEGPGGPDPRVGSPRAVNVFAQELDRTQVKPGLDVDHAYVRAIDEVHEFGDTRHHLATYFPKATSAFLPYFRETSHVTFGRRTTTNVGASPLSPAPITVTGDSGQAYREGADYTINRATGVLRRLDRLSGDPAIDEPVTVSFIRGVIEWEAAGLSRHILATRRPDPPLVHSLVPTFTWSTSFSAADGERPAVRTSTRGAGGLRVWLDRPWWSSGDNEQLGIIVSPVAAPNVDSREFVSMSGTDAISDSRNTKRVLSASDFSGNNPSIRVALAENGRQMEVVPYDVQFDEDRDQWFADITVNPNVAASPGYFPFVRLALVRFQPFAAVTDRFAVSPSDDTVLGDKQLLSVSSVVLTDFIQVAPMRDVFVSRSGRTVSVRVMGDSYVKLQDEATLTPRPAGRGPTEMIVTLQERDHAITDPELGWTTVLNRGPGLQGLRKNLASLTPSQVYASDRFLFNWTGSLTLPQNRLPADFRLLVEEFETHYSDADGQQAGNVTLQGTTPDHQLPSGRRCTFQDTIPLAGL